MSNIEKLLVAIWMAWILKSGVEIKRIMASILDLNQKLLDLNGQLIGISHICSKIDDIKKVIDKEHGWHIEDYVELMAAKHVRLWIKSVGKDASYTVFETESDCQTKRMRTLSQASYDAEGNMRKRQDDPLGWVSVVPDTFDESLYIGACSLVVR